MTICQLLYWHINFTPTALLIELLKIVIYFSMICSRTYVILLQTQAQPEQSTNCKIFFICLLTIFTHQLKIIINKSRSITSSLLSPLAIYLDQDLTIKHYMIEIPLQTPRQTIFWSHFVLFLFKYMCWDRLFSLILKRYYKTIF